MNNIAGDPDKIDAVTGYLDSNADNGIFGPSILAALKIIRENPALDAGLAAEEVNRFLPFEKVFGLKIEDDLCERILNSLNDALLAGDEQKTAIIYGIAASLFTAVRVRAGSETDFADIRLFEKNLASGEKLNGEEASNLNRIVENLTRFVSKRGEGFIFARKTQKRGSDGFEVVCLSKGGSIDFETSNKKLLFTEPGGVLLDMNDLASYSNEVFVKNDGNSNMITLRRWFSEKRSGRLNAFCLPGNAGIWHELDEKAKETAVENNALAVVFNSALVNSSDDVNRLSSYLGYLNSEINGSRSRLITPVLIVTGYDKSNFKNHPFYREFGSIFGKNIIFGDAVRNAAVSEEALLLGNNLEVAISRVVFSELGINVGESRIVIAGNDEITARERLSEAIRRNLPRIEAGDFQTFLTVARMLDKIFKNM